MVPHGAAVPATYEVVAVDNEDEDDDMGDDVGATKTPAIQLAAQQVVEPPLIRIVAPPQAPTASRQLMYQLASVVAAPRMPATHAVANQQLSPRSQPYLAGVVGFVDKWLIGTRILAPPVESHACSKTGKAWHNWAWWKVTLAQRLKKLGKLGVGDYTQAGVVGSFDKWLIVTHSLAASVESHACTKTEKLGKIVRGRVHTGGCL